MTQWDAIARRVAGCVGGLALVAGVPGGAALAQDSGFLSANLYGQFVEGSEGDEDASADWNAEVFGAGGAEAGRLCYYLDTEELDDASSLGLHRGSQGSVGDMVLALDLPGPGGDEVCVAADGALLAEVLADPEGFYLQIATGRYPQGAVRGQLEE